MEGHLNLLLRRTVPLMRVFSISFIVTCEQEVEVCPSQTEQSPVLMRGRVQGFSRGCSVQQVGEHCLDTYIF